MVVFGHCRIGKSSHSFVWEWGRELLALLAPKTGERIVDLGCGTGQLTAENARSGAEAVGIENSPAMIAEARGNFPKQHFEAADVTAMRYHAEFRRSLFELNAKKAAGTAGPRRLRL